jgi:hypothetical protein
MPELGCGVAVVVVAPCWGGFDINARPMPKMAIAVVSAAVNTSVRVE